MAASTKAGDLRRQRILRLHLAGNLDGLADGLAGEALDLDQLVGDPLPAELREKASVTDHLPKGILAHRRTKQVEVAASP